MDFLTSGMSEELDGLLEALETATDGNGRPQYRPGVATSLRYDICGRAYGPLVFRLCALLRAFSHRRGLSDAVLGFYGAGIVRRSTIRAALDRTEGRRGTGTEHGILCAWTAGETYLVHDKDMEQLVCLLDFLTASVGFDVLETETGPLFSDDATLATQRAVANALCRHLYNFLEPHLRRSQTQRQFNAIASYLKKVADGDTGLVDDDIILGFWESANEDDADSEIRGDFRLYRSAVLGFLDFMSAIELAAVQAKVAQARPVGADREGGDLDFSAEDAAQAVEALLPPGAILDAIGDPSTAPVKLMTKKDLGLARPVISAGPHARHLARTLLRFHSFGDLQNRVSKTLAALRPADGGTARQPDRPFVQVQSELTAFAAKADRINLKIVQSLAQAGSAVAVEHILEIRPGTDVSGLLQDIEADALATDAGSRIHGVETKNAVDRFIGILNGTCDAPTPALRALVREIRAASIDFKGFSEAARGEQEELDAMEAGAPAMRAVERRISELVSELERLSQTADLLAEWQTADSARFVAALARMYGE